MIQVEHLTKKFASVLAVDDISFRVEKGKIWGFLGPNGAGKTTTMRILTGYLPANEGRALINGIDVGNDLRAVQAPGGLPARGRPRLQRADRQGVPALRGRAARPGEKRRSAAPSSASSRRPTCRASTAA